MGDLHLSTNQTTNKSMEVFGKRWTGYIQKLETNWDAVVEATDTVIIPGDISWAMRLDEAVDDFKWLQNRPGIKLIGKGNHDFWWATQRKMQSFFDEHGFDSFRILYNNAYIVEDQIVCGTRGWFLDEHQQVTVGDADYNKIVAREVIRLKMSLEQARQLQEDHAASTGVVLPVVVCLHFPPVWQNFCCTEFVDLFHQYGVNHCYFGHIHGSYSVNGHFEHEGIHFTLVASDFLNFSPLPVRFD
jgi:predicted phosphohydrolase